MLSHSSNILANDRLYKTHLGPSVLILGKMSSTSSCMSRLSSINGGAWRTIILLQMLKRTSCNWFVPSLKLHKAYFHILLLLSLSTLCLNHTSWLQVVFFFKSLHFGVLSAKTKVVIRNQSSRQIKNCQKSGPRVSSITHTSK